MKRTEFLKGSIGFLGMSLLAPGIIRSGNDLETMSCTETNAETAGPFPTIDPASLQQTIIMGDRTGIPFTINITIKNINDACNALEGAKVDIWHCDKDGYYSEYGGTAMQQVDYTASHFLRGRQITNANGQVSFGSIFPGWYQSRATHIHVHIYDASGNSLLITQIAFPEGSDSAVVAVNAATAYGYTKGMTGYTYNASDNVFSDGVASEMSTITGSIDDGYVLEHTIYVDGPAASGINEINAKDEFSLGKNFPNPFVLSTTIPIQLNTPSMVKLNVFDIMGKQVATQTTKNLASGFHYIELNKEVEHLPSGKYPFQVVVSNSNGIFMQGGLMVKE